MRTAVTQDEHALNQDVTLDIGQVGIWRAGPLALYVRRSESEWQTAAVRGDEATVPAASGADSGGGPEAEAWHRFSGGSDPLPVRVIPVLADRPIVVRPSSDVRILPGREASFFVSLPLWLRVVLGAPPETLIEEPTVILSNSWFGAPTEGELCYALRTPAQTRLEDLEVSGHCAVCVVRIQNGSTEQLEYQRLCLRTGQLGVYGSECGLWTNSVRVTYRGQDEWSRITSGRKPPRQAGETELVAAPRHPQQRGVLMKTFSNLKGFSPF